MDFFLIWVFPALMLGGIGLLLLFSTIKHIRRCKSVAGWSKTEAVIESSEIDRVRTRRFNRAIGRGYRSVHYVPKIGYTYSVMGTPFHSNGYRNFAGNYTKNDREEAAAVTAAYPVGKSVTIHYDPNNPADAYLLPETDTTRLIKARTRQLIMVAIALVWFGIGAVINLTGALGEKAAETQVRESAGVLPGTTDDFYAKLEPLVEKYQLTCQDEGTFGYKLAYHVRACRAAPDMDLTSFEVLNRKEDPAKADLLTAIYTPADQEKTLLFYHDAVTLVFNGEEQTTAAEWVAESLQSIVDGEQDTLETTVGGIKLTLSDLGGTVRLNIGDLQ